MYNKWKPLKTGMDELPEIKDDSVLVHFENGCIETVHIVDYFGDIGDGVDADGVQLYTKWYLSQPVTHWMELPKPPQKPINEVSNEIQKR